jgi:6-phosphofructokinase
MEGSDLLRHAVRKAAAATEAKHLRGPGNSGSFPGMSTLAEIEKAIGKLLHEQWQEIRRWMECHAPKEGAEPRTGEPADFDRWLAASTGIAMRRFTMDGRIRETRGED